MLRVGRLASEVIAYTVNGNSKQRQAAPRRNVRSSSKLAREDEMPDVEVVRETSEDKDSSEGSSRMYISNAPVDS